MQSSLGSLEGVSSPVRVRIAPSPTGDPHVGTGFIGLFNMVFARQCKGAFVLRIEDTDQARSTRESEAAIFQSLRWLGVHWDEGPDVGGPYGPYRQSERTEIYREHAGRLLASGAAYRCFCTSERLEAVRARQREEKGAIRYDGHCRNLDPQDAEHRASQGETHVVRLRVERGGAFTVVPDLLRDPIQYDHEQIDDQVLLKSDGFPTYHLANVVDDHLMAITHVIRAEEWIPSTPKHLMLYAAFGWKPPVFIHMPLLRNRDRSKISKRKNPVSLEYYQRAGFLPEALLNFLGLMGFSMPDDQEKFSIDEMVERFDWKRVSLTGPVFDVEKLEWLNGLYLRELDDASLVRRVCEAVLDTALLERIAPLLRERIRRLDQFLPMAQYMLSADLEWDAATLVPKGMDPATTAAGLMAMVERLDAVVPWTRDRIEASMREFVGQDPVWNVKRAFPLVRVVVTGRTASPGLFETMELVGKALVQDRFRRAARTLELLDSAQS